MNYVNHIFNLALATALMFLSNVALSQDASNQSTGPVTLISVENWVASDALYIRASDLTIKNPNNCTITDRYLMPSNASEFARSMVLAAYAAGHQVSFTIYGSDCSNDRPMIVSVKYEGN